MLLCAQYVMPITGEPIKDGAVLVSGDTIVDIGPAASLRLRYPEEELHDYGNSVLMPGFVNVHSHLENTVLREMVHDQPYAKWLSAKKGYASRLDMRDWQVSTLIGALESIASGITCIADIAGSQAVVQILTNLGLRGVVYREVGTMDKRRISGAMNLALRDIDKWRNLSNESLITVGISPSALHVCHPSIFGTVSKCAQKEQLPVAIHVAGTKEEYNFIRRGSSPFSIEMMSDRGGYVELPPWLPTGVSPVRYALNWGAFEADQVLAIHCIHVDEEDIRKLKEYNVAVGMCPRFSAQLGMGVAPYSEFRRAGMHVGIGTDSPAATDEVDMLEELRIGLLLHRALETNDFVSASEILELATLGGARCLGLDDKIGSLEVGKQADIIAVSMVGAHKSTVLDPVSNMVNTCNSTDVTMTMVAGRILYENSEHKNIDVNLADCVASMFDIRERLRQG